MVNLLKRIGQWFIGKSEAVEKLDEEIQKVINVQTERAFGLGFGLGVIVAAVIVKLFVLKTM